MATSRVLEVIDGLATVFDAAAALDGVTILKAWEILPEGELEHVFVAWDGDPGNVEEASAESVIEWPGLSPTSRTEDGTVECAATVWTGDQTATDATLTRVYAILGACEDALRANPSLSSSIALQAKITNTALRVEQSTQGFRATVPFTVSFMSSI